MKVSEAHSLWNLSEGTIRRYCKSGIIPGAEKGRFGRWEIPDVSDKPPFTRTGLCFLMEHVFVIQEQGEYKNKKWGHSITRVEKGLKYLSDYCFIAGFNEEETLENNMMNIRLTSAGESLLRKEAEDNCKTVYYRLVGEVEFRCFKFSVEVKNH